MFNIHFVILCNCFDEFSCEPDVIVSKHVHVVLTYPGMTMWGTVGVGTFMSRRYHYDAG